MEIPILFQQHQFRFSVSTALQAVKIDPRGKSVPTERYLVQRGQSAGHVLSALVKDAGAFSTAL